MDLLSGGIMSWIRSNKLLLKELAKKNHYAKPVPIMQRWNPEEATLNTLAKYHSFLYIIYKKKMVSQGISNSICVPRVWHKL